MQKIPLNLASPDMILARDIFRSGSPAGIPICGKGTVLTASLLARLQQLGIQSLYVEGHPVRQEGDLSPEQQLRELDHRFAKTLDNRYNLILRDIYRKQISDMMGEQGGRPSE